MLTTLEAEATGTCKVCGDDFQPGGHYDRERLIKIGICQDCDFWMEKYRMRNNLNVARIGGQHYIVGEENDVVKGMGGSESVIIFADGRQVRTTNLWHQGSIPATFQEILTDNAAFLKV